MTNLAFYFDPLCPWAWRTSLWIREVQAQGQVQVNWKVLSLAIIHRGDDPVAKSVPTPIDLRTLIQARRTGGDAAVDRLYLALGKARHDRRENLSNEDVVEAALQEAELDRALLRRALDDASTDEAVMAEHNDAVQRFGAFGVPWLVLEDQPFGFFGPVISEVPRGEAALELWRHVEWILQQPYLYEIKRERG